MEDKKLRTDANRRQTECNEACFDCRGAKEETPEGGNDSHRSKEIEDARSEMIFNYYQWWKAEHPEKKIFNKELGDYIHVNHDSLVETIRYAKLSYLSTTAVLHLDELLANATLVSEVKTDPSTKSQHPYEKMLIMRHKLQDVGDVRLIVGVRRSDRTTKIQYSITVIDVESGNGFGENKRHKRKTSRNKPAR